MKLINKNGYYKLSWKYRIVKFIDKFIKGE